MNLNKSKEEIRANDSWQVHKTQSELITGFDKLSELGACISIFGSARLKEDHKYYKLAEEIAFKLSEKGYGIITGGGPGIMEAANKGAQRGGSASIGCGIRLSYEKENNKYIDKDKNMVFNYFHIRKVMFLKYSQGFVVLQGGYGSLDELFEVFALATTNKTEKFPIILVGTDYWGGLIDWIKNTVLANGCITQQEFELFRIVDTADEVVSSFEKYFVKYRKEHKLNF